MRIRFIWRALKARYRDQKAEIAAIRETIRPDSIAVDVGANKGSYVYWLARWTPAGRTVAFEPQDELAEYLRAAAETLHLNNVVVEAKGVADKPGRLELFSPGRKVSPGASFSHRVADRGDFAQTTKDVVSLDTYFDAGAPVSVIKVDVEGFELQVFKGAQRILGESSPLLVFECENRHLEEGTVDDVLQFLYDRGYDGHFVHRGRLIQARQFDSATRQREVGEKFYADKDYCNNFIFRRSGILPRYAIGSIRAQSRQDAAPSVRSGISRCFYTALAGCSVLMRTEFNDARSQSCQSHSFSPRPA